MKDKGVCVEAFRILGGKSLNGELCVDSAKNALLPLLACSIMSQGEIIIKDCSKFVDVVHMVEILETLGVKKTFEGEDLHLDCRYADKFFVSEEQTKQVRSSIFMLGPLLARFKKARVAYPGGCNIGTRPIDLHLKGLRELNVKIEERHGYIYCDGSNMRSNQLHLDFPSVGTTENLMMACALLKGESKIHNAAKEPEVEDLQNFLNAMGAKVYGAGSSTITIVGVEKLHGCVYKPISDRIITGTYLIAAAMAGGKIKLTNVQSEHNLALLNKLFQAGCKIKQDKDTITLQMSRRPKSLSRVETMPYPGFPTDLQSQILTLQTISNGNSAIIENLFETRFKIYPELMKMGAEITIKDRMAIVNGVNKLYGATVVSPDLRGGASLVLAGLVAEGYTTVQDVHLVDRGYHKMEEKLQALGADIQRIGTKNEK